MKELRDLVTVMNRQGIRKIDVLTPANKNGRLFELYEGVRKGDFETDEKALETLYGGSSGEAAYKKLKNRLKKQLMNTVIFASANPKLSERGVNVFSSYSSLATFLVLLGSSALTSGYAMGKRLMKLAMKNELTAVCLIVASHMRKLCVRKGDNKNFLYYNDLVHHYQELQKAELLAEEYEQNITIHFAKSRSAKVELAQKAKEYSEELKRYTDELDSSKLYLKAYNIYLMSYEIEGDLEKVKEVCDDVIVYFENKKPIRGTHVFFFLFKSLGYYLRMADFENGEKIIEKAAKLVTSRYNWNHFITIEKYIQLSFVCGKYNVAYEQYHEAVSQKKFELLLDSQKEHWKIYEAYLEFLKLTGYLIVKGEENNKNKFRLGKFLNEVPTYSKDKKGYNASILIVQILFLLKRKRYETLIDRADSLRIYAYRYLRKPETMRSFCFVKMLLEIIDAKFHKAAVVRKSEKHYKKMVAISLMDSSDIGVIEIVPFEELWRIVLSLLEAKFQNVKRKKPTKK